MDDSAFESLEKDFKEVILQKSVLHSSKQLSKYY